MGVGGKHLFSSKYQTAIVIDSSDNAEFVPIKNVIGEFFVTEIKGQIYVFKLTGRIITRPQTVTRTYRFRIYETSHYKPLDPRNNKEIELVLQKNALPRMNFMMWSIFKQLGRREKEKFVPHKLKALIEEVTKDPEAHTEEIKNIIQYLKNLDTEQIVTPVRKLSEFIEDDLLESDAGFMGEVISRYKRTDTEQKKITNTPIKERKSLIKWVAVGLMVALVIGAVFLLLGNGGLQAPNLSSIIPGLPGIPGQMTAQDYMRQYPTPESLIDAVKSGAVSENSLPPEIKKMLASYKPPTITPTIPQSKSIEITP